MNEIRGKGVVGFSLGPSLAPVRSLWGAWHPSAMLPADHLQALFQESLRFGEGFAKCVWGELCAFGRRLPVSEKTEICLPISQGREEFLWVQPAVGSGFLASLFFLNVM